MPIFGNGPHTALPGGRPGPSGDGLHYPGADPARREMACSVDALPDIPTPGSTLREDRMGIFPVAVA